MPIIDILMSIVINTPLWVWLILLSLIYQGISETKPKHISYRHFPIVIMIVLGVSILGVIRTPTIFSVMGFILGSIVGIMGYFLLKHRPLLMASDKKYIKKGSYVYLCLYLFVFVGQYITTAIAHIDHPMTDTAFYQIGLLLPRGVLLGMFWAIWYYRNRSFDGTYH